MSTTSAPRITSDQVHGLSDPASCGLCALRAGRAGELDRIKSYRTYAPGETIAWAGETARARRLGGRGRRDAVLDLADGRRQMVGLLFPSDFLGRPGGATPQSRRGGSDTVTFCMFHKSEFERLVARTPRIERRLLEMTLDDLDAAREWMLLLGRKTAREKIASLFVIMARRDACPEPAADSGRGPALPALHHPRGDGRLSRPHDRDRQPPDIGAEARGALPAGGEPYRHIPDFARLLEEAGDDADGGVLN
jgi:CRP/FNR family transcriptional regulator, anaerobic regulatory protein